MTVSAVPERLLPILGGCAAGRLPPNVALMRLCMESAAPDEIGRALDAIRSTSPSPHLDTLRHLWDTHPGVWDRTRAVLAQAEHARMPGAAGDEVAHWSRVFDRLSEQHAEDGSALYALGSADLLRATTAEVVDLIDGLGLLGPGRDALEIGCGSGRFLQALSPRLRSVTGLDISAGMLAAAGRRCAGLANVVLRRSDGLSLAGVETGSVDLVLAADVFPYLVAAGGDLARRHVEDSARVLRPGGALALFNYAYRDDRAADQRDVAASAEAAGLRVERDGTRDLALWDATFFLLVKPGA